jgi:hypothetical protein
MTYALKRFFFLCTLAAIGPACGSGSAAPGGSADAGGTIEASADAIAPDSGNVSGDAGRIGSACTGDGDCGGGTCIMAPFYTDGYCTLTGCAPATNAGCPADAVCRGKGAVMTTICFVRCSASAPCRTGYTCCGGPPDSGDGFCAPDKSSACQ